MAFKLLLIFIVAPHILALPVPGTFDHYYDINYVNLENTFMSKPSYDYAAQYPSHPGSFQNAHLPTYLRQEMPTYHILKPEYPSHLYPLHTVFFITAGSSQNQGIRPQTLGQQQFDYPDVQYDQSQSDVQSEAPKFHVQPETAPEFHVQPATAPDYHAQQEPTPDFHMKPEEPKFHVHPDTSRFHIQPVSTGFHVQPESTGFHVQPETTRFHITPETYQMQVKPLQFHITPETAPGFHVQPESPNFHLQAPQVHEDESVVREDRPIFPISSDVSDQAQTASVGPEENSNKSVEESGAEFPMMKSEQESGSNENVNINNRFISNSGEIPKLPQDVPPPVLISIDNQKVAPDSSEDTQFPGVTSSEEVTSNEQAKGNSPVEIPAIPFNSQPLLNSEEQTKETIQVEDDSKEQSEPLNKEPAKEEILPVTPVQSEQGSSEDNVPVGAETKETATPASIDDEVIMTTESNGTEVEDNVQTQNTKVLDFEATTETGQTSFK